MKTIVLLAVICVVGVYSHDVTDEKSEKTRKEIDDCIAESGVTKNLMDDIKSHREFTPTRELECFSACLLKKKGVMKADGTINHKPEDSEQKTACKNLVGKDDCETGGKIMECFSMNGLIPKE